MNGKISNFEQLASVRRYKFFEGKEEGIEVVECNNGKISFLLNVTKALDIMQLYHEGMNVSFISKNGFTKREIPFPKRFEGGMLYTCGLDSLANREGFELHGTFHNIPSKIVRCDCNEDGIFIEALIQDTALFGKNLTMKRYVYSSIGSNELNIVDTLINNGYKQEDYCLLYHFNIGYPMLDENCKIVADVASCESRTEWSEKFKDDYKLITSDVPNQEEMCYFLTLNYPKISLINNRINKRFTLEYSNDTLQCLLEWKSMASGDYALGFEPSTSFLDEKFEFKQINPNESIQFSFKIIIDNI